MVFELLERIPVFVLVVFRLAGMMLFAPLFGSTRIPRRVRVLLILVLALGISGTIEHSVELPGTTWALAAGIGGEMMFGLAMGTIISLVFIAAQWAGEIIGQQMGLNLSEVFDPQFGAHGSLMGDMYFMITLVVFLSIGGHRQMLTAVRASFDVLPLLSVGVGKPVLDLLTGLLLSSTQLAIQLAAPMLVTMLIVDLALGLIGKTLPQFNVMMAGLTLRSAVGMVVVICGLVLTSSVMTRAIGDAMQTVRDGWVTPQLAAR